MSDRSNQVEVRISGTAYRDMAAILNWSEVEFGLNAASRYRALLAQALQDIGDDPERPGSQKRDDLGGDLRVYHLRFSRQRARTATGIVHKPRHMLVYRRRPNQNVIDVLRVLHDAEDLANHLTDDPEP